MPRERALEALRALGDAGIETVLIGGWGIDALVGEELRPHGDLDLLADADQLERAVEALTGIGFEAWNHDPAPGSIGEVRYTSTQTLRDRALRVVELHAVDLSEVDGARGRIGAMPVSCLSADHQLHAQRQMGRAWTPQRRSNRRRNLAAVAGALEADAGDA
ncbi:MAG: nucleotidyltransferase domain-containing protein [Solirubrobacterales bacterium]